MVTIGKLLIVMGVLLVGLGCLFLWGAKIPFVGKLPGDIYVRRGNFILYAPIASCILISIILSVLLAFLFKKK